MRLISAGSIKISALQRINQENADFFSPAQILALMNQSIAEWYELLIGYGEELYLTSSTLSLATPVSGTTDTYQLPQNFFRLRGVDLNVNGFTWDLPEFEFKERNAYKNGPLIGYGYPSAYRLMGASGVQGATLGQKYIKLIPQPTTGNVVVWYYPDPPQLGADSDQIDTGGGWEEFIILHTAAKMLVMQGRDASLLIQLASGEQDRVRNSASKFDAGTPAHVTISRVWGHRKVRGGGGIVR